MSVSFLYYLLLTYTDKNCKKIMRKRQNIFPIFLIFVKIGKLFVNFDIQSFIAHKYRIEKGEGEISYSVQESI